MREMKNSGVEWIGEIPADKKLIGNKYLLQYTKGKLPSETNIELRGVPYIGASDLESEKSAETFTEDITLPDAQYDDLLVLWDGARAGLCGRHKTGKVSSTVMRIRGNNKVDPSFLYWYYKGFEWYMYSCVNGTTIPHMNRKYIEQISWINWNLEEQHCIADFLDEKCAKIDAVIEKQKQVIEKLKEYKLSVITEAVTKGLDPTVPMKDSGVEWIGEIPATWEALKFGKCVAIKSNLVPPEEYYDYPQISPESIEKNTGKLLTYKSVRDAGVISWNHYFKKGQIIYSKIRPTLNKITIAPFDGLCSADMYPIETENDSPFIMYAMLSNYFVAQVALVTENRVKMPKINQQELSNVLFALPPKIDQKSIADYLSKKSIEIDSIITKRQSIVEKLTEYKKSLIYEVVTGKREV